MLRLSGPGADPRAAIDDAKPYGLPFNGYPGTIKTSGGIVPPATTSSMRSTSKISTPTRKATSTRSSPRRTVSARHPQSSAADVHLLAPVRHGRLGHSALCAAMASCGSKRSGLNWSAQPTQVTAFVGSPYAGIFRSSSRYRSVR